MTRKKPQARRKRRRAKSSEGDGATSTENTKDQEGSTKNKPVGLWRLIPLYGLSVVGTQRGNTDPIFSRDATIIGVEAVKAAARTVIDLEHAHFFVGGNLRPLAAGLKNRPPMEGFSEIQPHSYIAVRRSSKDAEAYARVILALLCASIFYSTGATVGLSIDPRSQVWSIYLGETGWDEELKFSSKYIISQNQHIRRKPIIVTEEALRRSWDYGETIGNNWKLSMCSPDRSIFIGSGSGLTKFRQKLRGAAVTLAAAYSTYSYSGQILFAVSAIEQILATRDFKEIGRFLGFFFRGDEQREKIGRVLDTRHIYTHLGQEESSQKEAQEIASTALKIAWKILHVGMCNTSYFQSPKEWLDFLRKLITVEEFSYQLSEATKSSMLAEIIPDGVTGIQEYSI